MAFVECLAGELNELFSVRYVCRLCVSRIYFYNFHLYICIAFTLLYHGMLRQKVKAAPEFHQTCVQYT